MLCVFLSFPCHFPLFLKLVFISLATVYFPRLPLVGVMCTENDFSQTFQKFLLPPFTFCLLPLVEVNHVY